MVRIYHNVKHLSIESLLGCLFPVSVVYQQGIPHYLMRKAYDEAEPQAQYAEWLGSYVAVEGEVVGKGNDEDIIGYYIDVHRFCLLA